MSRIAQTMELRLYREEDAAATLRLFHAAVRRTSLADYSAPQVKAWAPELMDATAWAAARRSKPTWVADVGGQVIGFMDLCADGMIDMLYVHPDHGRLGVAMDLMAEVEQQARDLGVEELSASVPKTAGALFIRRGFRFDGPEAIEIRDITLSRVHMVKRLQEWRAAND